uniref:tRNA methyltransferase O n=1 Tax=Equus caballus TaxID=9796 RepID=A0A9L0S3J6_HORSE
GSGLGGCGPSGLGAVARTATCSAAALALGVVAGIGERVALPLVCASEGTRGGREARCAGGSNLLTEPIGYLESCFSAKNGTPRQPSICSHSRACLRIRKSIFNNPEHSLMGLEQFSHVWILFVFHKNGHLSCKAKVQPPRLNGAKTGVFSTRSPHRPNAIGLTLAKLEKVEDVSQASFKYFQSAE